MMSQSLSDKAKGKQRAVDPIISDIPQKLSRELMVRFTEGIPDLVLRVEERDSVRDVKLKIRTARSQLKNRRLRLIHSGRLLTDGTFLYPWLKSLEERQHRATAWDASNDTDDTAPPTPSSTLSWLQCSVGPEFAEGEGEEENTPQTAQLKPLRGFDRLTTAGFSEADIANFRRQFHSRSSFDYLATTDFATDEEYEEHARALEEQWIDQLDNAGSAALSQNNASGSEILHGIIVGFFFPLLPFFFFRETKPAVFWSNGAASESLRSNVFSRRMQMGLVVGFLVNLLFGFWRYLWGTL
ncbi:hypothetical protein HETIRDRAFT_439906 [Heterobasidion irregulare TC 32-1]|uniref:Ubiquitin-like domain-containing protein n=1 Tax=Heterobasidion irregulare (strain TC 32-1) TaxID=747525 RepID=W4K6K6_HETIT|nr:uncharacterized protein HETIRDRAFT_439906 [Heterobasidion irregulare TC 32-1]ETW81462.1 hypothetical protein HETIRDRAFT_439906 [Heterobasidion irregulare TC 32-1]